jgi:hypothetical protein
MAGALPSTIDVGISHRDRRTVDVCEEGLQSSLPARRGPGLWGTTTSSYQIKGACSEDGKGPSIWDTCAHMPRKIANAFANQARMPEMANGEHI